MALVEGNSKATGYGQQPPPPPVWDASIGTYRDPVTRMVAIGSDATGWRWVSEDEYRMMTAPAPFEDQVPTFDAGGQRAIDDRAAYTGIAYPYQQVDAAYRAPNTTYPSVPAPFASSVRGLDVKTPTMGQMSKNIEDRRNYMPPPIPAPAPTPAPPPYTNTDGTPRLGEVRIIGGQVVRF